MAISFVKIREWEEEAKGQMIQFNKVEFKNNEGNKWNLINKTNKQAKYNQRH